MDFARREQELLKEIGEIERDAREKIKPLQDELNKLRPPRNYIGPLGEPTPFMGTIFHRLFGFDL